jgi:two-component system sensor histidine kinase DegS
MTSIADLAEQLVAESARLDAEVKEIDLLVSQARTEAGRHETRRAAAAEKLAGLVPSSPASEAIDLANQAVTLTRRAALMEAQVEILEAKKKALVRLRESIDDHAARAAAISGAISGAISSEAPATGAEAVNDAAARERAASPAVSRIVLTAQEDLRREIARAMHDGPAQSLTNIVLQAEIVERLAGKDPDAVSAELRQLVAMVQQTLEATKTFIFDVRPMVLDDLGLVPTLRRATRDRGRRAGVVVEFESLGMDQRLPVEVETTLFRILDEALAGYLAAHPERVSLRLDWGDELEAVLTAERTPQEILPPDLPADGQSLPPALAAMVEERRTGHTDAVEAARRAAIVQLPANAWPDLQTRAGSHGIEAQLLDEGGRLRLAMQLPSMGGREAAAAPTAG